MTATLTTTVLGADAQTDVLAPWRSGVTFREVCPEKDAHTIHTYFNTCPESPDGKYVLYYRSTAVDAGVGDICVIERATGKVTVLAKNVAVTDAHSAAAQQWVSNGKRVVYRMERDGQWVVMCVDVDGRNERVVARDWLSGFGQPTADVVPLFGPYWKLGEHRDLMILNVASGEITPGVTPAEVRAAYPDWVNKNFGDRPTSIFFGILSPDLTRVMFKLSTPSSGNLQSSDSSSRDGLLCYDLKAKRMLPLNESAWGHPAWYVDSKTIVQQHDFMIDTDTGVKRSIPGLPDYYSSHPSSSPDGKILLKDMAVPEQGVDPKNWKLRGIDLCDINGSHELIITKFDNSQGAKSWRVSHPHPVFSADGRRIYYNVSSGPWTRLFVAERGDERR